jgi:Domain of unknown function (DUF4167)
MNETQNRNHMRQGQNGRRPRGRHHGGSGGGGGGHSGGHDRGNSGGNPNLNTNNNRPRSASSLRHQNFDSNCIDIRVRGNAWQVHEKYQALARDAQSSGDRVSAEHYLQHAEHYYRIIEAINEATALEQQQRPAGSPAPAPFNPQTGGQQPEVPTNYYGTDGVTQPSGMQPTQQQPNGNTTPQTAPPPTEATVQPRGVQPQQPPNPFFQPEDTDDQNGPQPLIARR